MIKISNDHKSGAMIDLVIKHYHEGDLAKAETLCREILGNQSKNAEALHILGLIYFRRGDSAVALNYITKAVEINPSLADARSDMGIILQGMGRLDEAIESYQKALRIRPDFVRASYSLGTAFQAKGDLDGALANYRRVIQLDPNFPGSYFNLGVIRQMEGALDEATDLYRKTIELAPGFAGAYYALGALLQGRGQVDEAVALYQKCIELNPYFAEAYNNLGVIWQGREETGKALSCYQKATELNPEFEQAFNNLGNAYRDAGEREKALESYKHAIKINPGYVLAYYNLGNILAYQGRTDEATFAYDKALEYKPDFLSAKWAKCIARLPIIYPDEESIRIARDRYYYELMKLRDSISLEDDRLIESAVAAVGSHQPFLLACQGMNDKDLQQSYGDLVCRIMGKRYPQFTGWLSPKYSPGGPLRVGIVSAYFHYHSIWKIPLRGWIETIDRERFELFGYYTGRIKDQATGIARKQCKKFVEDISSFEELCGMIRRDNLHVLLYPEIGMDTMTLRLAALRLAPIQCTSLGHPDTSGLPTMDYYLSSDLMEPAEGDDHYTERLVRLPNLGFYYTPFEVEPARVSRETFGLRRESLLYLCSHALFTYLPQYDDVFPRIAKQVGDCQFLFISHEDRNSVVTEQFHRRIKAAFDRFGISDEPYVVYLPPLTPAQYNAVNVMSDVFLDSIGWSANNSTFEAIACDLPVVTFPGELMRQRHCSGILKMMDLNETIASSIDDYIDIATRLGKDREWRRGLSSKIAATKHRIYRDRSCITALEGFIEKVIKERLLE